ncbi:hypothetical protein AAFF_G00185480 [Aldrovandia affinis]|uniref:Uncharacterized protein n=1 Tax=Aldrovandia affinis TaxID=143900 RepID=A0AAD7W6E4_9TELE|nr:hypothetical protein AAFF_G00185480 [Aldrovandia affinis]
MKLILKNEKVTLSMHFMPTKAEVAQRVEDTRVWKTHSSKKESGHRQEDTGEWTQTRGHMQQQC